MSMVLKKDSRLEMEISIEGGKLIVKYGDFEVCRCHYPVARNPVVSFYSFQQDGEVLKLRAYDTGDSALKCEVRLKIIEDGSGRVLFSTVYSFLNSSGDPSGYADAVDLPVTVR